MGDSNAAVRGEWRAGIRLIRVGTTLLATPIRGIFIQGMWGFMEATIAGMGIAGGKESACGDRKGDEGGRCLFEAGNKHGEVGVLITSRMIWRE